MPVKTAFKRSLLNSQPLPPKEQREAVKNLTDNSSPKPGSGFDVASLGFSDYIERQVSTLRDSPDAVSLSGVQDSNLALQISCDPQRPELILLTRLFENAPDDVREILRLRAFEACLDEADYQRFLALLANSKSITNDYEKRLKSANDVRVDVSAVLDGLMEIASSVDSYRDAMDFLLNSSKIHLASVKYLTGYPSRYTTSSEVWQPALIRTFAGLQESLELSNSSLVSTLLTSLTLPGSIRYEVTKGGDRNKNRFLVPRVSSDPTSQLLAKLSQIDVTTPDGFSQAESLLPSDPVKRLSIIAEALSYELTLSVGLKSIKQQNISSYLINKVGITTSPIFDSPPASSYSSVIRSDDKLPLESKDYVVDGNTFKGSLSAFVDPAVQSGELNFKNLSDYSKKFTTSLNAYVAEIKKLRLLDDSSEELSSVTLIKGAASAVLNGASSLIAYSADKDFESLDKKQIAQIAYLKYLTESDTGTGVLDPRYKTFMKYFGSQEFVLDTSTSEPESPSASTTLRSKTRSSTESVQVSKVTSEIKSSTPSESRTIESLVKTSDARTSTAVERIANLTAGTAGGLKAGVQISSMLGTSTKKTLGSARGTSTNKPIGASETSIASAVRSPTSKILTETIRSLEDFEANLPPTEYYSGTKGSSYLNPFGTSNTSFDIENVDLSTDYKAPSSESTQTGITQATSLLFGITSVITQTALSDITVADILGDSITSVLGSSKSFVGGMTSNNVLDGSNVLPTLETSVSNLTIGRSGGRQALDVSAQVSSLFSVGSDLSSNLQGGAIKLNNTLTDTFGSLSVSTISDPQPLIGAGSALSYSTPRLDISSNIGDSSSPFLDIPLNLPSVSIPPLALPNSSGISSAAASALSSTSVGLKSIDNEAYSLENLSVSSTSNTKATGISGLSSKLEQSPSDINPEETVGARVPRSLSTGLSQTTGNKNSLLNGVAGSAGSSNQLTSNAGKVAGSASGLNYSTSNKPESSDNASEKLLKSEDILGLSIDSNGLQKYAKIMQKTTDVESIIRLTTEPSSISKTKKSISSFNLSDIKNNVLGTDGASTRSRAVGQFGVRSRVYGKSTVPDTRTATSVSAEYKPYLAIFEPSIDSSSGVQFTTSFAGVLSSIVDSSTSKNPLLSGAVRNFVKETLNSAGEKVGDPDAFSKMTGCYGLSRSMLEFLFYSMCLSMLPSIDSVESGYKFAESRRDFDLSCRIDESRVSSTVKLFDSVSQLEGSINDVLKTLENLNIDKSIFSSIGYCHSCTNLVKERVAVLESYINSYSTAVTNLSSLSASKTVSDSLKKLRERQSLSILNDLSTETISAAQLTFVNLRGPSTLPRQARITRISEKVTTLLLQELAKNGSRNFAYMTVGIPSKSIEYMRRSPVAEGEQDFEIEGKEYIEVEVTKRDLQYSDLIMKKCSIRFCPSLSVVPQMTRAKTMKEAAFDFVYLCHDGKKWETKGFSDAVDFVKNITGLTVSESMLVVYNHVIDAIGKLAVSSLTGVNVDEKLATQESIRMNLAGAEFYRKVLTDQIVSQAIPVDSVLPGSYLLQESAGYSVLPFSRLPSSVVTKTNEPSHRLLYSIASDPLFTYENYYRGAYEPPPFERVYMCLVDPDEFVIDKFATVSTPSGKSSYEYLIATGKITETEQVANLNDREASGSLDGNEFAVKVSLVTG